MKMRLELLYPVLRQLFYLMKMGKVYDLASLLWNLACFTLLSPLTLYVTV